MTDSVSNSTIEASLTMSSTPYNHQGMELSTEYSTIQYVSEWIR